MAEGEPITQAEADEIVAEELANTQSEAAKTAQTDILVEDATEEATKNTN